MTSDNVFDLLLNKKPNEATYEAILDPGVAAEYVDAKARADLMRRRSDLAPNNLDFADEAQAAQDRLDALEGRLGDLIVKVKFRALGRDEYDALVDLHPPTEKQRKDARREARAAGETKVADLNWNTDTFPVALIAACSVEPDMSEAQVRALWDSPTWNAAELNAMFMTAYNVCNTRRVANLGKDSTPTSASDSNSTTASPEESLTLVSSDE